jgi:hypothetical protein
MNKKENKYNIKELKEKEKKNFGKNIVCQE